MSIKFWLLAAVVGANAIGQILFKLAADSVRSVTEFNLIVLILIRSPAMWLALLFYGVTVVLWIWILRILPLSVAYSAIALVFVIVPFAGVFLFNEPVSTRFIIGALMIGLGVWLVSLG